MWDLSKIQVICCALLFKSHWFPKSLQIQAHFLTQVADSTVNVVAWTHVVGWIECFWGFFFPSVKAPVLPSNRKMAIVGLCAFFFFWWRTLWQLNPGEISDSHVLFTKERACLPGFCKTVFLGGKKCFTSLTLCPERFIYCFSMSPLNVSN